MKKWLKVERVAPISPKTTIIVGTHIQAEDSNTRRSPVIACREQATAGALVAARSWRSVRIQRNVVAQRRSTRLRL